MSHRILAALACLGFAPAVMAVGDCAHRAERNLDIDASEVKTLVFAAGAGEFELTGEAGLEQVVVRGIACASDADRLAAIQLQQRSDGERLSIAAQLPESESGWFGSSYQSLDLQVRVPARMLLEVADSSGDLRVAGVAMASVQDSSGDLELEGIQGDVTVSDSSGDISVRGVGGNVRIPGDSSGDIEIADVGGSVSIERDSSGDIDLRQVRGDATVGVDSSGGIRFADVDGSARVGSDSSGSIEAHRIGRDFIVEHDGAGEIEHSEIGGSLQLPQQD